MKKILFFIFCITTQKLMAIGFHEIKFTHFADGKPTEYTGLFIYYSDSSKQNKMRVRYRDIEHGLIIIEQKITIKFRKSRFRNRRFRVLEGSNVKLIIGNGTDLDYAPDRFIFKKSAQDTFFKPYYSKDAFGTGKITSYTFLDTIVNEYLDSFALGKKSNNISIPNYYYNHKFNNKFSGIANFNKFFYIEKTIYIVLVSNTIIVDIKDFCRSNDKYLSFYLENLSLLAGYKVNLIRILENDFNKSTIIDSLRRLEINSNLDGIIFYYSGHGVRSGDQLSRFPCLDLRTNHIRQGLDAEHTIFLDNISEIIRSKRCSFSLTISESCNSIEPLIFFSDREGVFSAASRIQWTHIDRIDQLFRFTGDAIVCTASPLQQSFYGRKGGYFKTAFCDLLDEAFGIGNDFEISWRSFIEISSERASIETQRDFGAVQNVIFDGFN